ncbi:MAG: hypothetical protein IPO21_17650 [Bacteroidales bacterium]|nr:hypothetical protein [Bacteroidales bacterium]
MDYTLQIWKRPFKLLTELYYKNLSHIIPYTLDNVKINYKPELEAHGYATGLDIRINGEFVKGTESWASISFLSTEEQLDGSDEWIKRPSNQFLNFGMFFQDYFPGYDRIKVNLTFLYGSKLPTGPPNAISHEESDNYSISSYKRVDLGISTVIIQKKDTDLKKKKGLQSLWIGLEVFNLLDISNKISYLWIKDLEDKNHRVPNYLTSRVINLKISAKL